MKNKIHINLPISNIGLPERSSLLDVNYNHQYSQNSEEDEVSNYNHNYEGNMVVEYSYDKLYESNKVKKFDDDNGDSRMNDSNNSSCYYFNYKKSITPNPHQRDAKKCYTNRNHQQTRGGKSQNYRQARLNDSLTSSYMFEPTSPYISSHQSNSEDSIFGRKTNRSNYKLRPVNYPQKTTTNNANIQDQNINKSTASNTATNKSIFTYLSRMSKQKQQRLKDRLRIKNIEDYLRNYNGCEEVEAFLCEEIGELEFMKLYNNPDFYKDQQTNTQNLRTLSDEERNLAFLRLVGERSGKNEKKTRHEDVKAQKVLLKTSEVPILLKNKDLSYGEKGKDEVDMLSANDFNNLFKDRIRIRPMSSNSYLPVKSKLVMQKPVLNYNQFPINQKLMTCGSQQHLTQNFTNQQNTISGLFSAPNNYNHHNNESNQELHKKERQQLTIPTQTLQLRIKKKRPRKQSFNKLQNQHTINKTPTTTIINNFAQNQQTKKLKLFSTMTTPIHQQESFSQQMSNVLTHQQSKKEHQIKLNIASSNQFRTMDSRKSLDLMSISMTPTPKNVEINEQAIEMQKKQLVQLNSILSKIVTDVSPKHKNSKYSMINDAISKDEKVIGLVPLNSKESNQAYSSLKSIIKQKQQMQDDKRKLTFLQKVKTLQSNQTPSDYLKSKHQTVDFLKLDMRPLKNQKQSIKENKK
eukprot:403357888